MESFWYLASPYSRYCAGINAAYNEAAKAVAILVRLRVPVFSPIAHFHTAAVLGGINPKDRAIWIPADRPMIDAARGIIVLRLKGWDESTGIEIERRLFREAGKPELFMDPGVLPSELRQR